MGRFGMLPIALPAFFWPADNKKLTAKCFSHQ
jgi:hypothetical protein